MKRDLAGDHVDGAGQGLEAADGADQLRLAPRRCARPRARTRRRRRARPGAFPSAPCPRGPPSPSPPTAQSRQAVDRGDHAHRQPCRLQHRPLLDVQLGVGEHVLAAAGGLRNRSRIEPQASSAPRACVMPRHRRASRTCGVNVPATARLPRSVAFRSARLPRRRSRSPRPRAAGGARARAARWTHSIAAHHAEHAVVLARVEHRVEVRAEHRGRAGRGACPRSGRRRCRRSRDARSCPRRASSRARARSRGAARGRGTRASGRRRLRVPGERLAAVPDPLRRGLDRFSHEASPVGRRPRAPRPG